ncbi:hypothetical protein DY000_02053754 [Brassica cretica]|uniref:Auxin-responsive protein n=1 Tax=Brassica cretica TaxID=69181 RepID=A0ABQ7AIQ0_BRACR|nr:hypothetical protein DY000_02053754 [Brassica cretica]
MQRSDGRSDTDASTAAKGAESAIEKYILGNKLEEIHLGEARSHDGSFLKGLGEILGNLPYLVLVLLFFTLITDHPPPRLPSNLISQTQIVGWPPVRSNRKNNNKSVSYVKVSMDGAPYLRKVDLKMYKNYHELLKALENMFKFTIGEYSEREGYKGSGFLPTYEDKDGDWMLVGDVLWDMFSSSCQKLRIMKRSEAPAF